MAFDGFSNVTSVEWPESLKKIGDYAFRGSGLRWIYIDDDLSIGIEAFAACKDLSSVDLIGTRSIADGAFRDCSDIRTVQIIGNPTLGGSIFENCIGLTNTVFSSIINILPDRIFYGCTALASFEIPSYTQSIGAQSFGNCSALVEVKIPENVTSVGSRAFENCLSLQTLQFTADAPQISSDAFAGSTFDAFYPPDNGTWTASVCQNYGGNVTWYAGYPIRGLCGRDCSWSFDAETGTLTISGDGYMEDYHGVGMAPWSVFREQIDHLVVESGVASLGDYAFAGCTSLSDISWWDTLSRLGEYTFSGCTSLTEVTLPGSINSGVPEGLFENCTALQSVTLEDSIDTIEDYAFRGCTSLQEIHFSEALSSVGEYAFQDCTSLTEINLGSVFSVNNGVFSGCSALKTAVVPEIPPFIFSGCTSLTEVSVTFGDYSDAKFGAFSGCENLETVTFLGKAPKSFSQGAFDGVTATVYYPAEASDWKERDLSAFGGDMDWIPLPLTGSCGTDVTYTIDPAAGTLTISGTGTLNAWDRFYNLAPWRGYEHVLSHVIVEDVLMQFNNLGIFYDRITFRDCAPGRFASDAFANSYDGNYEEPGGTVYYPANDSSWDAFAGKDFGGSRQWIETGSTADILKDIRSRAKTLTPEQICAEVQEIGWEALLEAMESASVREDLYWLNYIVMNETEAAWQSPIIIDVPELSALSQTTTFWEHTNLALNGLTDPERGTEIVYSPSREPIPVPAGYNAEEAIQFSVSFPNVQETDLLAVPVYAGIDFSFSTSPNPYFLAVFWRNNETGIVEEIPATTAWTMVGNSLSFAMKGSGDYLLVPRTAVYTGKCGDGLTWTYSHDAALTISGTGAMYNYNKTDNPAPWTYFREHVLSITIDDQVTEICDAAFYDCRFTNFVNIPASVTRIGTQAFSECSDLTLLFQGDAPEIVKNAFYNLHSGVAYYDPMNNGWEETVKSIYGADDFGWNPIFNNGSCGDDLTWILDENTATLTISGTGDMWDYDSYGSGEREEAPWVPRNDLIRKIILEEGVTGIGSYAFHKCTNVEQILLPESLTTISHGSLPLVEEITIPAAVNLLSESSGINNISRVHISDENQHYSYADGILFNKDKTVVLGCYIGKCGSYTVPEGVVSISQNAFSGVEGLTEVNLPDSLELIEDWAFNGCLGLTKVKIPDHVTEVGNLAFSNCVNLKKITFGNSLERIGMEAIAYNSALKEIWFTGDAPEIEDDAFFYVTAMAYYPDNSTWTPDIRQNYGGTITWIPYGNVALEITSQPSDYVGALNSNASFSVSVNRDDVTYQWYYTNDNGKTWLKSGSTGNNTDTLTIQIKEHRLEQQYRCEITDSEGNVVVSEPAGMLLPPSTIEIVTQPADAAGIPAEQVPFTVEATGLNLTYRWYYSNDGGKSWGASWSEGYNTATLLPVLRAYNSGRMFKCLVTDGNGNTEWTEAATMVLDSSEIIITSQPADYQGAMNELTEFTVVAEGKNLEYRWYYSTDQGANWKETWLEGYNKATLQVRLYSNRTGYQYKCVITSGNTVVVETEAATLSLRPSTAVITQQPLNAGAQAGQSVTFQVAATGNALKYQWQFSNTGGETWGNSSMTGSDTNTINVVVTSSRDGNQYRCKITDDSGRPIYSDAATLRMGDMPVITKQPESYTGAVNEVAVFTVETTGENLQYQWQYSNNNGATWSPSGSAGCTTNSLEVELKSHRNGQQYRCVITNEYGCVISDAAIMTVN